MWPWRFHEWPDAALQSVAHHFLGKQGMPEDVLGGRDVLEVLSKSKRRGEHLRCDAEERALPYFIAFLKQNCMYLRSLLLRSDFRKRSSATTTPGPRSEA